MPKSRLSYQYQALKSPLTDIRLVTLLRGNVADDITIEISHVSLLETLESSKRGLQVPIPALNATLTDDWKAYETTDGRVLFYNWNKLADASTKQTWRHPNPDFDQSLLVPLDDPNFEPKYEALSYAWGDASDPVKICVKMEDDSHSGSSSLREFLISQNLDVAFRNLRYPDKDRRLWIDAICINQFDIEERNNQVRRMHDIYRLAQRVIVWLGLSTHDSSLALSTLRGMGQQIVVAKEMYFMAHPDSSPPNWSLADFRLPYDAKIVASLESLVQRPWFTRMWIMQEIQLASPKSIVQVGSDFIPWSVLQACLLVLSVKAHHFSASLRRKIVDELYFILIDYRKQSFPRIIKGARHKHCSDLRDKVYGAIGLATPQLRDAVQINYTLSSVDAWKSLILAHIQTVQRLEFLGLCGLDKSRENTRVPSWVPDLSSSTGNDCLLNGQFASGYSRTFAAFKPPASLEVAGLYCGKVSRVQEPTPRDDIAKIVSTIRQWEPDELHTKTYLPTGEILIDAYAKTLATNHLLERIPDYETFLRFADWVRQDSKTALFRSHPNDPPLNSIDVSEISFTEHEILVALADRTFIMTENGYIGIGPSKSEVGDEIYVLFGAESPALLRPCETGNYLFLGECFIHGLEDATALLGPLPKPWVVQIHREATSTRSRRYRYFNHITGELSDEDPRLGRLEGWEVIDSVWTSNDPEIFRRFRNREGEIINYDPRLVPERIKERGVSISTITLV